MASINSPEGKALLSEELPPHEREPWTLMAKHKQAQFCPGTPHLCVETALVDRPRTGRMVYLLMHLASHLVKDLGPAQVFKWAELLAEGAPGIDLAIVPPAVRSHSAKIGSDGSAYDAPLGKKRVKSEGAAYVVHDEDQLQPKRYGAEASPNGAKVAPDSGMEDDPRRWLTFQQHVRQVSVTDVH